MIKRMGILLMMATIAVIGVALTEVSSDPGRHSLIATANARGGGGGGGGYRAGVSGDRALSSVDVSGVARRSARYCPDYEKYPYNC
jgi:hypothetical protein